MCVTQTIPKSFKASVTKKHYLRISVILYIFDQARSFRQFMINLNNVYIRRIIEFPMQVSTRDNVVAPKLCYMSQVR